ncbi:hypothetical protein EDB83DRAFT_2647318 [Lactarius deliciosus]|nr:hypothetical protein EDB83DRAFT_2647318 [Lactarius deliciosus]
MPPSLQNVHGFNTLQIGGLTSSQPVPFPPYDSLVSSLAASKSRHQRYTKSHVLNYDLFDLLILHLNIPAPAEDDHRFHVTFPPLQWCYFPQFLRAALLAARHHLHLQISVLPVASGDAPALSPIWTWPAPIFSSHPPSRTSFPDQDHACTSPSSPQRIIVSTPSTFEPRSHGSPDSRRANPVFARLGVRLVLPAAVLSRVSKRFSAAAQHVLYHAPRALR